MLRVPFRETGCSGSLTLFEPPPSVPVSPEKRPPEAASKMLTATMSPNPERDRGAPPPIPNVLARLAGTLRREEISDRLIEFDDRKRRR